MRGAQSLNELAGVLYPSGVSTHPSKVLWRRIDRWFMLAEMGAQQEGPRWSEGPVRQVKARVEGVALRWRRLLSTRQSREDVYSVQWGY